MVSIYRKLLTFVCLILYYGAVIHLPPSYYFKPFKTIRYLLCKNIVKSCGENVNFEKGANFGLDVSIGNDSGLGINCVVEKAKIGDNVMMGMDVIIMSGSHKFDNCSVPMIMQGNKIEKEVIVEDDVWIGHRVIIMPGVKIRKGAIIGAGAVVTRDVPQYAIVGGVPARVIKYRNRV